MTRVRLPAQREIVTWTLVLDGRKLHVTLGLYGDGRVGELFVSTARAGTHLRTALEAWAMAVSKGLQYGEPLAEVVRTFRGTRTSPAICRCPAVPALDGARVESDYDAVARLLEAVADAGGRIRA